MRMTTIREASRGLVRRAARGAGLSAVGVLLALGGAWSTSTTAVAQDAEHSVARQWNEVLLQAIRDDFARPTVHARNLYHTSVAMWDAWVAFDDSSGAGAGSGGAAAAVLVHERAVVETGSPAELEARRDEAISFAAYGVIVERFAGSPGTVETLAAADALMDELGYDRTFTSLEGATPAALGNRIADAVLTFGESDGANEANDYANLFYAPVNAPLLPNFPGNDTLTDFNRWQPLTLDFFVDQSGNIVPGGTPDFLSPEWGVVTPFALAAADRTVFERDGNEYVLFHDPGPPPLLSGEGDAEYKAGFAQVVAFSSLLDPSDGSMIDIGPGARGNNTLGTNDGAGRGLNPATGLAYAPNVVPAGDYYRVLAEFWADGPDSETPPGHWFTLANYVSDHEDVVKQLGGAGPVLGDLEWDVKLYLALGGAMHDSAVTAWGVKGWYDYIRPVSAIRFMAGRGQSSDPSGTSYHPLGIGLQPGLIELVTAETAAPGQRHAHLTTANIGKVALYAWRGPDFIDNEQTDTAGVGWILSDNWWPYQRPSFVTPPFAGYVSGHSTYSRAAAALLTGFTGSEFWPGGLGEFAAPRDEFLVFEDGPSVDITLQWATYGDAADECSLSRIYGGIHPRADDTPGRLMGAEIGPDALAKALTHVAPESSLTITGGKAKPTKRGKGVVVVEGVLVTGVADPDGVLDVGSGLVLTAQYGDGRIASGTIGADRCKTNRRGKIRAKRKDKRATATFKPVKDAPGTYAFVVKLKVDVFGEVGSGLTLQIHAGQAVRGGVAAVCAVDPKNGKLTCAEE